MQPRRTNRTHHPERVWLAIMAMAVINGAIPLVIHLTAWTIGVYIAWCAISGFTVGWRSNGRWGR